MPTTGRWGRIIAVIRLTTGLILFFYVLTHNLNHALGLISLSAMEAGRIAALRQRSKSRSSLPAPSSHGLALGSTSSCGRARSGREKLVDGKAKLAMTNGVD